MDEVYGSAFIDYYNRLMDFILPSDLPRRFKQTLEKYGDYNIYTIMVARDPIQKGVSRLLDILSAGEVTRRIKKMHYDDFFHLYLILDIEHEVTGHRQRLHLRLEKNNVVSLEEYDDTPKEFIHVNMYGRLILLAEFIANGKKVMGKNFVRYDAIYNNCQVFVKTLLSANNLLTPYLERFIMQDVGKVLSTPIYGLSRLVIDFANIFGHIFS